MAGTYVRLVEEQRRLAGKVITDDELPATIRTVAGVDAAFPRGRGVTRAAVVLMSFPELDLLDEVVVERATEMPYIPGLLSFRELPAVLAALEQLKITPDLILCDGQGRAHPRRFGIACHLGVETGLATVGVAKSRLCGTFEEPGNLKGEQSALHDGDERIGMVVRSRAGVRPIFVSNGHRISLGSAVKFAMTCTPRYRLPEPIRLADRLAGLGHHSSV